MVGTNVNIFEILNGDADQFSAFLQHWPEGRTAFASEFYDSLIQDSDLHEDIQGLLKDLRPEVINYANDNDAVFCDPDNPIRLFLSQVLKKSSTWYPVPGRLGQEFPTRMLALWREHFAKPANLVIALNEYLARDEKKADLAEKRLCESESGAIKQAYAHSRVLTLLNQHLNACLIPEGIRNFFESDCRTELNYCLLNIEANKDSWKYWSLVIEEAGFIFKSDGKSGRSELTQRIQGLLTLIEQGPKMDTCHEDVHHTFIESMNAALFTRLKGEFDTEEPWKRLINGQGSDAEFASLSKAAAQKAKGLNVGDWFLFTDEHERVLRCKLALKPEGTKQLLFVNAHGRKVMQKDVETFLLCLSAAVAKPLKSNNQFELSFTRLINKKRELLEAEQDSQRAQVKQEEEARANELVTEQEHGSNLKGARPLNSSELPSEPVSQREQEDSEDLQRAEHSLSTLHVGARVELLGDGGESTHCKLAVIIRGSDKFIFTDRLGKKVAELAKSELLSRFMHQQVIVHGAGENFEDQLAKVIRGLRKT